MKPLRPDTLKVMIAINCNEASKTTGKNTKRKRG
jgi:hypothetical protein